MRPQLDHPRRPPKRQGAAIHIQTLTYGRTEVFFQSIRESTTASPPSRPNKVVNQRPAHHKSHERLYPQPPKRNVHPHAPVPSLPRAVRTSRTSSPRSRAEILLRDAARGTQVDEEAGEEGAGEEESEAYGGFEAEGAGGEAEERGGEGAD